MDGPGKTARAEENHRGSARALSAAEHIVQRLRAAGHEALFAGGCVRDLLAGRVPGDYDVATSARAEEVQHLFSRTCLLYTSDAADEL